MDSRTLSVGSGWYKPESHNQTLSSLLCFTGFGGEKNPAMNFKLQLSPSSDLRKAKTSDVIKIKVLLEQEPDLPSQTHQKERPGKTN